MNQDQDIQLSPMEDVIAAFKQGEMVVMVDDPDRENEGDLVIATECVTPQAISDMMHQARGLICVSIDSERAERLNIPLQVLNNNSLFQTPFTISIDHEAVAPSGVEAAARAHTMKRLIAADATAEEFSSPGHVFPLIAHSSGTLGRQGQTEGSYDLARLAGLEASGIICEILNEDGTMMRGQDLNRFAEKYGYPVTSVEAIVQYRVTNEILVRCVSESVQETHYGEFTVFVFHDEQARKEHLLLAYGDIRNADKPLLTRVHSECLTGDVFGSRRCDCGPQLDQAMQSIVEEGAGLLLYLRQEGRGIGLLNKLKAYALQDQGMDTVEANLHLGFPADSRDFAVAARMLGILSVDNVRLMTNNPEKVKALETFGISVDSRVSVRVAPDEHSEAYLKTKKDKLGHLL